MYCKCSNPIPEARKSLGYKTCIKCSTEERWSAIPIINHKTGNEIQIVKDREVAEEFMKKSARVGFGTLRGLKSSYTTKRLTISEPIKIEPKPVSDKIVISRIPLPNEYEKVGEEVMQILESRGIDSAHVHIEKALSQKRIYKNHANSLRSILEAITCM